VSVTDIVKAIVPGSVEFLLLGLAIGALLLAVPRGVPWARRWFGGLIASYLVLSLQGTSDLLISGLWSDPPIQRAADTRGARTIVVLGNGAVLIRLEDRGVYLLNAQTAYNAIEAARVHALIGEADIITSGGPAGNGAGSEAEALANALTDMRVPRDRITLDAGSYTTRQQCEHVAAWLRARGVSMFILVTTPEHMRRARGVFQRMGLTPIPSASEIAYGGAPFWRPTRYALQGSHNALYEYIALVSYRLRGLI
jgi:uncharacterized SAM-binding protein YcdF (DUF218 family)